MGGFEVGGGRGYLLWGVMDCGSGSIYGGGDGVGIRGVIGGRSGGDTVVIRGLI